MSQPTPADLKTIAELLQDARTPCQRDGHNYQLHGNATDVLLYCTKCGETRPMPSPGTIGFAKP